MAAVQIYLPQLTYAMGCLLNFDGDTDRVEVIDWLGRKIFGFSLFEDVRAWVISHAQRERSGEESRLRTAFLKVPTENMLLRYVCNILAA